MIQRPAHLNALKRLVSHHPVVALVGARQVEKTTLARDLAWSRKGRLIFSTLSPPLISHVLPIRCWRFPPCEVSLYWTKSSGGPIFFPRCACCPTAPTAPPAFLFSAVRLPACCAKAQKPWPDALPTTSFPGSLCPSSPKAKQIFSGFEVGFRVRLPRAVTSKAMNGGESSSEPSLNGTFPSWGSRSQALRLTGSGQCLRIITLKSGTVRNSHAHSAFRTIPCVATSTHLKRHSWCEA